MDPLDMLPPTPLSKTLTDNIDVGLFGNKVDTFGLFCVFQVPEIFHFYVVLSSVFLGCLRYSESTKILKGGFIISVLLYDSIDTIS